jgi:hypothetical protein
LVDFGSSKGRVPLMAASAKQAFGKTIGVEYVTDLYETALRNASRFPGTKVEFYLHRCCAVLHPSRALRTIFL